MSIVAAFLADIIANPDDDTPRLIYADWLDEHDDPARAEFIRVQCRLTRSDAAGLLQREQELLAEHRDGWLRDLPAWTSKDAVFRRGFVEEVSGLCTHFLGSAPLLFRATPLRAVRLRGAASSMVDLASCPQMARVRRLGLNGNRLDGGRLSALLASPHLAALSVLDVSKNQLGLYGARVLASSQWLAKLVEVDLSDNQLTDEAARALAESPNSRGLRVLDLSRNVLMLEAARALAESPYLRRLRELNLEANPLGDRGVHFLGWTTRLPALERLNVSQCGLGDEGARALARSPLLSSLRYLQAGKNPISPAAWASLRQRCDAQQILLA